MQPLILQIKRKTLVSTKPTAIRHQQRSDWKTLHTVSYEQSYEIFGVLGGVIHTEAQFAKLLYENYGEGEYLCVAFRKGLRGMWNFLKLNIDEHGFRRVEKGMTEEEKMIRNDIIDYRNLQKRYEEAETEEERDYFGKEIGKMSFMDSIFMKRSKKKRKGPMGYLKPAIPVYKAHAFEDYEVREKGVYNPMSEIW
jgi:hypothetical protein